ncbi:MULTISPECIES: hypothetical protein [unclassified Crossiella]|uniref:hypothetical protein n=1 Tax=unclassified Crossiella TaxID=2620835 RepID=UPI001FFE430D|nr:MULTISPECIES: hypothetical protein [unclassified Crossiella]MCK2237066.1 hypothetical protein [Crossiella sp. S99.2]MCK2250734.1 hypothetical protein [Crossiella sp. S99.1]
MSAPLAPDSGAYSVEQYRALLAGTPLPRLEEVHAAVWPRLSPQVRRTVLVCFAQRSGEEELGGGGELGTVAAGAAGGFAGEQATDYLFADPDPGDAVATRPPGPEPPEPPGPTEPAEQQPERP